MPVMVAVEGRNFFNLLRSYFSASEEFKTLVEGWNHSELSDRKQCSLVEGLRNLAKTRTFPSVVKAIGIISDAETNRDKADGVIRSAIKTIWNVDLTREGEIVDAGGLKISYMIVPKSRTTGCIEHDCITSCTLPPALIKCAADFEEAVRKIKTDLTENNAAKLRVYALIAASSDPDATLGQSVLTNLWDFNQPFLSHIRDFVRNLLASIPATRETA